MKLLFKNITFLIWLAAFCAIGLHIYLLAGTIKTWAIISWVDVVGEGCTAMLFLFWLLMILKSRPSGYVTSLLAIGLCSFVFSAWMDWLDEFIKLPKTFEWNHWFESLPSSIGFVFTSLGLYHWHKEEIALRAQLSKQERVFREYRLFDHFIPLNGAEYVRKQLELMNKSDSPVGLIVIEINHFNDIIRQFGTVESNKILQSVTQLLLLNLRDDDLICRLAGERFMVLLNDASTSFTAQVAADLEQAVASLVVRSDNQERIRLSASTIIQSPKANEDPEALLKRINIQFNKLKSV